MTRKEKDRVGKTPFQTPWELLTTSTSSFSVFLSRTNARSRHSLKMSDVAAETKAGEDMIVRIGKEKAIMARLSSALAVGGMEKEGDRIDPVSLGTVVAEAQAFVMKTKEGVALIAKCAFIADVRRTLGAAYGTKEKPLWKVGNKRREDRPTHARAHARRQAGHGKKKKNKKKKRHSLIKTPNTRGKSPESNKKEYSYS